MPTGVRKLVMRILVRGGAMLKKLSVNGHMMFLIICRRDVLDHKQKGCFKDIRGFCK